MHIPYFDDRSFEKIDFTKDVFEKGNYDNCTFTDCNFSGINLSDVCFLHCELVRCNLSLAKIIETAFKEVHFLDCKIIGLHFENCAKFLFDVSFDNCTLNLCSFFKMKMKKTRFINCSLHEVDFTETDLTESLFEDCDLRDALFDRTILEKADFSTAENYSIDPESNRIKKARFALSGLHGLLEKYNLTIINKL